MIGSARYGPQGFHPGAKTKSVFMVVIIPFQFYSGIDC